MRSMREAFHSALLWLLPPYVTQVDAPTHGTSACAITPTLLADGLVCVGVFIGGGCRSSLVRAMEPLRVSQ